MESRSRTPDLWRSFDGSLDAADLEQMVFADVRKPRGAGAADCEASRTGAHGHCILDAIYGIGPYRLACAFLSKEETEMKLGVATVCLSSLSLTRRADILKEQGVQQVEIGCAVLAGDRALRRAENGGRPRSGG